MNDLIETTSALIETGNPASSKATAIRVLKALSATFRNSLDSKGYNLSDCADWIDLQLKQLNPNTDES